MARERRKNAILRLCWETNGSMQERLLDEMMDLALESGGCVKFDLKAWDDTLHVALTGVSNRRTLENFSRAAVSIKRRPAPPLLIASTLLVPGYIAFHPHFRMDDLPRTPGSLARGCLQAAKEAGLSRVRMGR